MISWGWGWGETALYKLEISQVAKVKYQQKARSFSVLTFTLLVWGPGRSWTPVVEGETGRADIGPSKLAVT